MQCGRGFFFLRLAGSIAASEIKNFSPNNFSPFDFGADFWLDFYFKLLQEFFCSNFNGFFYMTSFI